MSEFCNFAQDDAKREQLVVVLQRVTNPSGVNVTRAVIFNPYPFGRYGMFDVYDVVEGHDAACRSHVEWMYPGIKYV